MRFPRSRPHAESIVVGKVRFDGRMWRMAIGCQREGSCGGLKLFLILLFCLTYRHLLKIILLECFLPFLTILRSQRFRHIDSQTVGSHTSFGTISIKRFLKILVLHITNNPSEGCLVDRGPTFQRQHLFQIEFVVGVQNRFIGNSEKV